MTSEEALTSLLRSVEFTAFLKKKTDAQLAELILNCVWAKVPKTSRISDLIDEVIERLKRANGGPNE